nr:amino acid ABC transporter substrate-binding protein [Pseudomonas segetis]
MNMKHTKRLLGCAFALAISLPVSATAATLDRVRSSGEITMGYLPDVEPFSSKQGDKVDGYAIDICRNIAARVKQQLELPELRLNFQAVGDDHAVKAVSTGDVDILCTPLPQTLARRKQISYSLPIYTAGLAALVRDDAPERLVRILQGKEGHTGPTWRATINRGIATHTFAVIKGGVTLDWIRQQMNKLGLVAKLVTVDNHEQGIQAVADGEASAFISDRILLTSYAHKSAHSNSVRVLGNIYERAPVSMVLERGDEDFRLLVDTVISEMSESGDLLKTYRKYLGAPSAADESLLKLYALPVIESDH